MMRVLIIGLASLCMISGCATQCRKFSSLEDVRAHLRAEYRKADHLGNWEPEPFDRTHSNRTTITGHTFSVLPFAMGRNGSLYVVEHMRNGRIRIVGQFWGNRVEFVDRNGIVVARTTFHISVAENPVTEVQYKNGVFGSFRMNQIRPEFYK
jgi:hypothetical protein